MSLYSFFQKIKYRRVAKTRHGVHSPFVYDFIEKIINGKTDQANSSDLNLQVLSELSSKQQKIVSRIAAQYSVSEIHYNTKIELLSSGVSDRKMYLFENKILGCNFEKNDIVVILNIYNHKIANEAWLHTYNYPEVSLSLDLFELGILFFREEFKVKQHFILRY